MLNDFTWNMNGYIPKHQVNPHGDDIIPYVAERIFQLEPEPPAVDSLNEYILSALQEKDLIYFSFFLHHYEPQLNKRIKDFLGVDGGDLYDTDPVSYTHLDVYKRQVHHIGAANPKFFCHSGHR